MWQLGNYELLLPQNFVYRNIEKKQETKTGKYSTINNTLSILPLEDSS